MSERIVAVIPIRSLRHGKTRLAGVLGPNQREALLRETARDVVDAARHSNVVESVLVVSPDHETLDWAAALGPDVFALAQPPDRPGLNGAIETGRGWALRDGAGALLSLFADLPYLMPCDVCALTAHSAELVLGPDRRGEGTNAMLIRLAGAAREFRFAFGEDSLRKHLAEADRLGLDVSVHNARGIGFDLDTPEDWVAYLLATPARATTGDPLGAACGAGAG